MNTLIVAKMGLTAFFLFLLQANLTHAAAQEPSTNAVAPKQEIKQLLKENEDLRRELMPNDQDIISELKKDNKRLQDEIEKKKRPWEREISAGANLTRGNSDTIRVNAGIKAKYNKGKNKLDLSVTGDYGESEDVKNLERASGQGQYDYSFSKRFYWLLYASAEHDDMAKLDYRLIVSPGLGCKILSTAKAKLDVTLGPAYVVEQFRRPTAISENQSQRDDFSDAVAVRASETFEYKISASSKATQKFSVLSDVSDMNDTILRGEIGVESELTRKLNLRIALMDNFVNEPAADAQRNDLYLISSLVLKF